MFTKFILTLITIIMLISLAGCSTVSQSTPTTSGGSNATPGGSSSSITDTNATEYNQMLPVISQSVANMKLDASANGTTQTLKKGEVMSISLESNPSTGYSWYATIANTNVLVSMGEPVYQEPSAASTPVVGAPGTQIFYFQAVEVGTTTITLDYKRGWETNVAPVQTVAFTVEVQ